jgi:hypothetical protein
VLDRVEALVNETPPVDNAASRFGNPAFKTFYDKVQQVRDGFRLSLPSVSRGDQYRQGDRLPPRSLGCSATPRVASCPTSRCYHRGVRLLLRVVGKSDAHRLREWDGAEFSLLAVCIAVCAVPYVYLMRLVLGFVLKSWESFMRAIMWRW